MSITLTKAKLEERNEELVRISNKLFRENNELIQILKDISIIRSKCFIPNDTIVGDLDKRMNKILNIK